VTDRTQAGLLRRMQSRLTSLERRISRTPRATPAAALASVADVKLSAGGALQSGWLLCDGALYTSAAQPGLFAAIGTTYNVGGEAPGEFRVPDLDATVVDPNLVYVIKA